MAAQVAGRAEKAGNAAARVAEDTAAVQVEGMEVGWVVGTQLRC